MCSSNIKRNDKNWLNISNFKIAFLQNKESPRWVIVKSAVRQSGGATGIVLILDAETTPSSENVLF